MDYVMAGNCFTIKPEGRVAGLLKDVFRLTPVARRNTGYGKITAPRH